jgi:cytidylate kinase
MVEKPYIITIDGKVGQCAGVGKSELADKLTKTVPERLNLSCVHFDTGLFFRAIAYAISKDGKNLDSMSDEELGGYLSSSPFVSEFTKEPDGKNAQVKFYKEFEGEKIELSEQFLRLAHTDDVSSKLGGNQIAAKWMEEERKKLVMQSGIDVVIINGRDTAATYFPDADLKIVLGESEKHRTRRRVLEKVFAGETNVDSEKVRLGLLVRDIKDAELLKHNSSLDGVWEIDRTGLSSRRLSELVTEALGVVTGTEPFRLNKAIVNRWVAVNDGESQIATSNLELESAFLDPILAFAMLGMSDLHRVVQKHVGGNKIATEIIYK